MKSLLLYDCKNNIGQLQSDIRLAVANAYLNHIRDSNEILDIHLSYFNKVLSERKNNYRGKTYEVEILVPKDLDYYIFYPSGKEENFIFKELKNEDNNEGKAKLSLVREGIRNDILIESLFMDIKFFKLCENIRQLVENELQIVLSEKKFYSMAIYMHSIIENNSLKSSRNKIDINAVRKNNKEEFKVALKIIAAIESEFNVFLSIEDAAYIALFIVKDQEEENVKVDDNVEIIVAMHGDSTASSMVKAVKEILGGGKIYSFDMKLNKSYKEIVEEFKEIIKKLNGRDGVLLFTDMGSLNSFDEIIKQELNTQVRTIPMVTTLMVLEALQKVNIGFSLIEVCDSIINMKNYCVNREVDIINDQRDNIIIVGYNVSEGVDKKTKNIIREKLKTYVEDIDILAVPYEDEQDFKVAVSKLINDNNVIAIINDFPLEISTIDYIEKQQLGSSNGIEKLRTLIKVNKGYFDIAEGLKSSLKYTYYSKILEDIRITINTLLLKLNIKKEYDMVIGLSMHMAFMIDGLVGKTRISESFPVEKLKKQEDNLQIVKKEMIRLERKYKITIDNDECYGILCILYSNL